MLKKKLESWQTFKKLIYAKSLGNVPGKKIKSDDFIRDGKINARNTVSS